MWNISKLFKGGSLSNRVEEARTVRRSLGSIGSGGTWHNNYDTKRSVWYDGISICFYRIERPGKPYTYQWQCGNAETRDILERLQKRWDYIDESPNGGDYQFRHIHDECWKFSEEFDNSQDMHRTASLHIEFVHPFTNSVYTKRSGLTPAWINGTVEPRRKDTHNDRLDDDADAGDSRIGEEHSG